MTSILPTVDTVNVHTRSRAREAFLPTVVGVAVLVTSLVNLLSAETYPLLTPEVALLVAAFAAIALFMGLVYAFADPISRALFQFLLLLLALDLNFDGPVVLAAAVVTAAVVHRHLMPFLGIVSLVVFATEIPSISYSAAVEDDASFSTPVRDPSLPNLVHLILDEHIGIEGLTGDDDALGMGQNLRSFYISNGFRLYGGAFSEHMHTVNAIPSLLNFGEEQPWLPETSKEGTIVPNNRYFELLKQRGYAITVYQTAFADYCVHPAVSACLTRPRRLLLALNSNSLAASDKAIVLGHQLIRRSRVMKIANAHFISLAGFGINLRDSRLPHGVTAIETLQLVAKQLGTSAGGTAFFVHVLFPHYPYIFASNCEPKPSSDWLARRSAWGVASTLQDRQFTYYEQLSCLTQVLQPIFNAADPRTIIVVHGDHGSRITEVDPRADTIGRFSSSDMIASFSTLFAVRAPAIASGYDPRPLPSSMLFRELALADFGEPNLNVPVDYKPSVILDDLNWKPSSRHPLPSDWPQADH
jgi:hypothetical protein